MKAGTGACVLVAQANETIAFGVRLFKYLIYTTVSSQERDWTIWQGIRNYDLIFIFPDHIQEVGAQDVAESNMALLSLSQCQKL